VSAPTSQPSVVKSTFAANLRTWQANIGCAVPDELCKFKGRLAQGCKLHDLLLNAFVVIIKGLPQLLQLSNETFKFSRSSL
jgi:hypothetical protein